MVPQMIEKPSFAINQIYRRNKFDQVNPQNKQKET